MEEMHQHKVAQMIKSAEGSAGLSCTRSRKPTAWRGGAQILEKEEEDADCWTAVKHEEERMGEALAV